MNSNEISMIMAQRRRCDWLPQLPSCSCQAFSSLAGAYGNAHVTPYICTNVYNQAGGPANTLEGAHMHAYERSYLITINGLMSLDLCFTCGHACMCA